MYGRGGGITTVLTSSTVTGSGVILLPNTGGNTLAMVLAYTAISVGVAALLSQVVVRLVRRFN